MFKGPLDFTPLTIDVGHAWTPASYIPLKPQKPLPNRAANATAARGVPTTP